MNYKQKKQFKKVGKWALIIAAVVLVVRFVRKHAKKAAPATETH